MKGEIASVYVNGNPVSRGGSVTVPKNKKWDLRVRVKLKERHTYTGITVYYGTKEERKERTSFAYKEYWVKWNDMTPILNPTIVTIKLYARNLRSHDLDSFSFVVRPYETRGQSGTYRAPSPSVNPSPVSYGGFEEEGAKEETQIKKEYLIYGGLGILALGGVLYIVKKSRRVY